jgi:hypothetical protein
MTMSLEFLHTNLSLELRNAKLLRTTAISSVANARNSFDNQAVVLRTLQLRTGPDGKNAKNNKSTSESRAISD